MVSQVINSKTCISNTRHVSPMPPKSCGEMDSWLGERVVFPGDMVSITFNFRYDCQLSLLVRVVMDQVIEHTHSEQNKTKQRPHHKKSTLSELEHQKVLASHRVAYICKMNNPYISICAVRMYFYTVFCVFS